MGKQGRHGRLVGLTEGKEIEWPEKRGEARKEGEESGNTVEAGQKRINGGFIKGILRGVRCTKSLRVLFLHRRPPSWTTLVLFSRAVLIFNEHA